MVRKISGRQQWYASYIIQKLMKKVDKDLFNEILEFLRKNDYEEAINKDMEDKTKKLIASKYFLIRNKVDKLVKTRIRLDDKTINKYEIHKGLTLTLIRYAYFIACLTAKEFDKNKSVEENLFNTSNNYSFNEYYSRATIIHKWSRERFDESPAIKLNCRVFLPYTYLKQMGYKSEKIQNKKIYDVMRKKIEYWKKEISSPDFYEDSKSILDEQLPIIP
jgi:hypothetical protein